MEQVTRIELVSSGWKPDILAFIRYLHMVGVIRIELILEDSKSSVLPLNDTPIYCNACIPVLYKSCSTKT